MRAIRLTRTSLALAGAAAVVIAGITLAITTRGVAHANPSAAETSFPAYTPPTGPELSADAVASAVVADARQWGEGGEVSLELAHGTLAQTKALMEGESLSSAKAREAELKSSTPSSTFCFGGQNSPCTGPEVEHAKQVLYEESQRSTYLVSMTGSRFSPPEKIPPGQKAVTGSTVLLLLDAHSGFRIGISIGGAMAVPNLSQLAGLARYVAGSESNLARAADKPVPSAPGPHFGSLSGTVRHAPKVVALVRRKVFAQTSVIRGRFRFARIHYGTYKLAGRTRSGRLCPAKWVSVFPSKETRVHLSC